MTAEIIYTGDLRTQATHLKSGTQIITDAPTDNQGKGEAFSPSDLVATALGSCMMTIMGIYAQRENIDLKDTKINITKIMTSESPRKIAEILVEIYFPKNLNLHEKHQISLKNAANSCPVALSLSADLKQTISFHF
ncbi:MAG: OsmC family peroxiredoxin [Bacteroidetes bacterium]|nr:MAG: OsmC family peroxiredoxin [Bacteroidota bacterium]TAG88503.1 MAG: OsmC family peroxiredoxin [Bacteroidota bacterium]